MASISWNFELTMFELTVHFNFEKIGNWQRFDNTFEQESPPACMQEAYQPWHIKYSICCPVPGGYLCWEYSIPGWGVPPNMDLVRRYPIPGREYPLAGVIPPQGGTLLPLAGGTPLLGLAGVPP